MNGFAAAMDSRASPDVAPLRFIAMSGGIRRVKSFSLDVQNRPGEAWRTLSRLGEDRVNLVFFVAYPISDEKARIHLVVHEPKALSAALERERLGPGEWADAFMVSGADRAGRAAEVLRHLADAQINVVAASGTAQDGTFGMILWVHPEDVSAAAAALSL
jgi:hypothetical protein